MFEEAKKLLDQCVRDELSDPAFGDSEIYWKIGENEIATGYFGSSTEEVSVKIDGEWVEFKGKEALDLKLCGTLGRREFN